MDSSWRYNKIAIDMDNSNAIFTILLNLFLKDHLPLLVVDREAGLGTAADMAEAMEADGTLLVEADHPLAVLEGLADMEAVVSHTNTSKHSNIQRVLLNSSHQLCI